MDPVEKGLGELRWRGGVSFRREPDGSVAVIEENDAGNAKIEVRLPTDDWICIVHAMAAPETHYGAVKAMHLGDGLPRRPEAGRSVRVTERSLRAALRRVEMELVNDAGFSREELQPDGKCIACEVASRMMRRLFGQTGGDR